MITSYDIFGIYKTSKQYLSENNGRFEEEYSHEVWFNFSLYQYIPCKYNNLAIINKLKENLAITYKKPKSWKCREVLGFKFDRFWNNWCLEHLNFLPT